jgi:preprotein translocase subunit YajC
MNRIGVAFGGGKAIGVPVLPLVVLFGFMTYFLIRSWKTPSAITWY